MDGTILNADHALTPYTMETLYLLSLRKVPFVFCTGRHYLSVLKTYKELCDYFFMRNEQLKEKKTISDFTGKDNVQRSEAMKEKDKDGSPLLPPDQQHGFYLVSSNGARIHSPSNQLLREHNIDPEIVKVLYEKFGLPFTNKKYVNTKTSLKGISSTFTTGDGEVLTEVVSTSAYTTDKWFATATFLPLDEMKKKFGTRPFVPLFDNEDPANAGHSVFDVFPLEGVGKVCFRSSDQSLLEGFEKELLEIFGDRATVCFSSRFSLDVMKKGISKASALEDVCNEINKERKNAKNDENTVSMENIVCFGDSMNDCEMLQRAGLGFIMSNSQERLKKTLVNNEVIGHHNDDSVAKKLRKLFNIQD